MFFLLLEAGVLLIEVELFAWEDVLRITDNIVGGCAPCVCVT